jgi:hypothetical protein
MDRHELESGGLADQPFENPLNEATEDHPIMNYLAHASIAIDWHVRALFV